MEKIRQNIRLTSKPKLPWFQLENLDITLADHIQAVAKPNFSNAWDQLGQDNEFEETYALSELHTVPGSF